MAQLNTVAEALEDLQAGKIILCIDDPDRENEGDMICAARFATTENVNFMARHARGLICTPMSEEVAQRLGLEQMVKVNTDNHCTAFTVSIDHVDTTTGISGASPAANASAPTPGPKICAAPAMCFPWWPGGGACSSGPATPRPPWICAAWRGCRNAACAARSCGRTAP